LKGVQPVADERKKEKRKMPWGRQKSSHTNQKKKKKGKS